MDGRDRLATGLRWVAAGRLSAQLVSWVGTIFVMRLLSPADYGLAAICASVTSIVAVVSESGIGAAIVQAKTLEREQIRSVFGASLIFSFVSALVLVLAAPWLAEFFRAPQARLLIQVSALHLVLSALGTLPDASLKRGMAFRGVSIVELLVGVVTSLSTVGLAWYGAGVWALIVGPLCGAVLRVVLLNALAPQRLWPSFRLGPAWGLIVFGLKVAVSSIASYVFGQSDVVIAGRVLSKAALGEYSVAMHLAMLPVTKVMGIFNQVVYPAIADLRRTGIDVRPRLLGGLRLFGHVLVPLLWGLGAVSPWLVPLLLGPSWEQAVVPLQLACLVSPLRLINVLMSTVIQGLGEAGLVLRNTVTGIVVLPLCFAIGAQFGAVGLAGAWCVGMPVLIVLNLHRARGVLTLGARDAMKALAPSLLCSLTMVAAIVTAGTLLGTAAGTVPGLLAMVLGGTLLYATLLWCFDRPSARALLAFVGRKGTSEV